MVHCPLPQVYNTKFVCWENERNEMVFQNSKKSKPTKNWLVWTASAVSFVSALTC